MALSDFFESMSGLIEGHLTAEQIAHRLGESRSGNTRLNLYRTLVRAQHVVALESVFTRLRDVMNQEAPEEFDRAVAAFVDRTFPTDRNPVEMGEAFVAELERLVAIGAWPEWSVPAADYTMALYRAGTEPFGSDTTGVVRPLLVRHYPFAVSGWFNSSTRTAPRVDPESLLIYRPRAEGRAQSYRASPEQIEYVGGLVGELPLQISDPQRTARIRATLSTVGILVSRGEVLPHLTVSSCAATRRQ